MADKTKGVEEVTGRVTDALPTSDLLKHEIQALLTALGERAMQSAMQRVTAATGRLTEYAEGGGGPGLMAAVTGAKSLTEGKSPLKAVMGGGMAGMKEKVKEKTGGGKGSQGKKSLKVTNIVEQIDVGVPVRDAYNLWTQFTEFPSFMKKVESVEHESDEKLNWRAQILWSHRTWEATIVEQIPDERIVWRSKGPKGHVDGAVSFHELAPNLTRVLLVLEYYPQGFFEYTGNLWRAQGRRARLELKHYRRHVMTNAILNPEEIVGWRGEIRDEEVVMDHETAVKHEQEAESRTDEDELDRDEDVGEEEDREDDVRDDEVGEETARDEVDRRRRSRRERSAQRESEDEEPEPERKRVPASRGQRAPGPGGRTAAGWSPPGAQPARGAGGTPVKRSLGIPERTRLADLIARGEVITSGCPLLTFGSANDPVPL